MQLIIQRIFRLKNAAAIDQCNSTFHCLAPEPKWNAEKEHFVSRRNTTYCSVEAFNLTCGMFLHVLVGLRVRVLCISTTVLRRRGHRTRALRSSEHVRGDVSWSIWKYVGRYYIRMHMHIICTYTHSYIRTSTERTSLVSRQPDTEADSV